jgi:hypothetical protein
MRFTNDGPDVTEIVAWAQRRARDQGRLVDRMRQVTDLYNGDVVIPLPEMDRNEDPAIANVVAEGLDNQADRIASVLPNLYFPPLRPGIDVSEAKARTRTRATQGWWQYNKMEVFLRRRARHLIGYATSPVLLVPDFDNHRPKWVYRDPLNTFPLMSDNPDDMTPADCIFKYKKSLGWLLKHFPNEIHGLNGYNPRHVDPQEDFDLIEYNDADVTVIAVLGNARNTWDIQVGDKPYAELTRYPNRAGICLAVTPGRVTLDRRKGQYDGTVGMFKAQARLMALNMIAIERGIFPDRFLVSQPGSQARIVDGPYDGRTGMVNVLAPGSDIKELTGQANPAAAQMEATLERNIRVSAGISADQSGESPTNIRTGKRGDAVLSAVLDPPIQAAQEMLAESLREETKRGIAIVKAYWGTEKKSFYVGTKFGKNPGPVTYTPNKDFEDDNCVVTYPMAGADANGQIIGIGQRIGLGMLSKYSAMELDPMIADPILEKKRTQQESLENAIMTTIEQQAAQGMLPPHDAARIGVLVVSGMNLFDAVDKVQKEAQARQATAAPTPSEGQVAPPESQPGLAQPGMGAEQPTIAPPDAGPTNFSDLLRTLARPRSEAAAESRAGGG